MNNIFLNKLYLENYKLFIKETLTFEDGLNIFDGPNGYGKTSVFDAIEFVITGTIKRITENKAINGSLKYNHIFLANDSRKDTIIKSEFYIKDAFNDSHKIVIAKKIPGVRTTVSSVDRNPKKLAEITETYLLPSFETEELRDDYLIPRDQLASKQIEWFGSTSQSMYTMLYYVQQEDRLEFFRATEKERVGSIDVLFQINAEKIKLREITQAQKKLKNTIIKGLEEKINTLSANISEGVSLSTLNKPEYFRLLSRDFPWDLETLRFRNESDFQEILKVISGIKAFRQEIESYEIDLKNRKGVDFLSLAEEVQQNRLLSFLFYSTIGEKLGDYIERQKNLNFLNKQYELSVNEKYVEIDYQQLSKVLDVEIDIAQIQVLIESYTYNQSNTKTTQQTLQSVLQIRKQLLNKSTELLGDNPSGICQYCGFDWKDSKILSEQIAATTKNLEKLADGSIQQCIKIIEQLKEIFVSKLKQAIENKQRAYLSDNLFNEFLRLHNPKFMQQSVDMSYILSLFNIESTFVFSSDPQNNTNAIAQLQNMIKSSIKLLPPEYESNKTRFGYDAILDTYFDSLEKAKEMSLEMIDKKIDFIRYSFQASQQELYKQLEALKEKKDTLKNIIEKDLNEYSTKWKQSISKYQAQILSKIEIPFYIYSARILQSYQGGQGILMSQSSGTEGEVDSIRFTSPGHEHDILYTMSSGQLSGVLLSFSLALHKIFKGDGLDVMFIDDPVQCMDDLNIVSFVELLRSEFAKSQLLISTHEKGFANYISYKYKKQNLPYKRINLKEL